MSEQTTTEQTTAEGHPEWCDPEHCTATTSRPTREEYQQAGANGEHASKPVVFGAYSKEAELRAWLSKSVAPWETSELLRITTGDRSLQWFGDEQLLDLFDLLTRHVTEMTQKYPALYGDRFGWVADRTARNEKKTTE